MEKIDIRVCPICSSEFIAKRPDKMCCSGNCSSRWSVIKSKGTTRKYTKRQNKNPNNVELLKSVEKFIKEMKSKSYYADYVDLLKLVDVYDLIYPNLNCIPYINDIEKSIDIMFLKICLWYKNQKCK